MKIALLTPFLVKCGVAAYSYYLTDALAKHNCEVYVVRLNRFGTKDDIYYQNYAEEVPLDQVDLIHLQHEYGLINWFELAFYSRLKTRMTMMGKRLPVATTMHSTGNLRVDRVVYQFSNAVVVHNEHQARIFKFPSTIIPMGVQKVGAMPDRDLAKRRWGIEGKTVGMFGFISEYKGLESLIQAVAKLPDVTLLVGGGWHVESETPYTTSIRAYAHQMAPGRVRFLNYIQEEDLASYFAACDVIVVGHHFISESMALMTALAHGKAVLASFQPAFVEKEKQNALITYQEVDDLKDRLNALLSEPELRATLEKNALAYAEKNSWLNIAAKHIKLYDSLMSGEKK